VLALAAVPFVVSEVGALRGNWDDIRAEADLYAELPTAIARAGGAGAVKRCHVYTGPYQVQALAWRLKMHSGDVDIVVRPPGIVFAPRYSALARDPRFAPLTATHDWVVRRTCRA
jgi:hypothetical protein